MVQIINTILSYFVMIKPVLGSSYRQYILSLWLPFYLSLPTFITSYGAGKLVDGYLPLSGVFALQVMVGILSFILMIIFSRNALVMEIKNQLVGSAKLKKLLRVG